MKKLLILFASILILGFSSSPSIASVHVGHKLLVDHHIRVLKGHFFVIYDLISEKDKELVAKTASMLEEMHKDKNKHNLLEIKEEIETRIILSAIQHIKAAIKGKHPEAYPANILSVWERIGKDVKITVVDGKWQMTYNKEPETKTKEKENKKIPVNDSWRRR